MRSLLLLCLLTLPACRSVWEEPGWVGRSDVELEREVGVASASSFIDLTRDSALGWAGYRSALWRFAPAAPGDTLTVKELLWQGRFSTRVAWLKRDGSGRWRVFDTLGWRADVVF